MTNETKNHLIEALKSIQEALKDDNIELYQRKLLLDSEHYIKNMIEWN